MRVLRTHSLALLAAAISLARASASEDATAATAAAVNTTTCNGQFYAYTQLAGYGYIANDARDKFGDTIGGIGSAIALEPGSWALAEDGMTYTGVLWGLPDRGWNTEGTLNYVNRVHKFNITLTTQPNATVDNPSAPNLDFTYLDTVLFAGPDGHPTTGLDALSILTYDGFPPLPAATWRGDGFGNDLDNGTSYTHISIDAEGLVVNNDGTFWVSDEYGPYVWLLAANGTIISVIRPPEAIIPKRDGNDSFSADSPAIWEDQDDDDVDPADNPTGRDNNHGFEGLSASADGETLYVLLQAATNQEGGLASQTEQNSRLVVYDVSDKLSPVYIAEYVVPLPFYNDYTAKASKNPKVAAQSEIHALPNGQFFVLARDSDFGHGQDESLSVYRHIDVFDISAATNIAGPTYDCATCAVADADSGDLDDDITAATYCSFLDFNVNSQLARFGMHNGGDQNATLLNEKWESIALAPVDPTDPGSDYFIISLSDNDFITQNGFLNQGQFQYADSSGYNLDSQALVFQVEMPV